MHLHQNAATWKRFWTKPSLAKPSQVIRRPRLSTLSGRAAPGTPQGEPHLWPGTLEKLCRGVTLPTYGAKLQHHGLRMNMGCHAPGRGLAHLALQNNMGQGLGTAPPSLGIAAGKGTKQQIRNSVKHIWHKPTARGVAGSLRQALRPRCPAHECS